MINTDRGECAATAWAQSALPDYSHAAQVFPRFWEPYRPRVVAEPLLTNSSGAPLEVDGGKLRLSMAQVISAVVANNLAVAAARYYPGMAQTDLMRARSGASPRGVDASVIPSVVFAGAEGGSILSSACGGAIVWLAAISNCCAGSCR